MRTPTSTSTSTSSPHGAVAAGTALGGKGIARHPDVLRVRAVLAVHVTLGAADGDPTTCAREAGAGEGPAVVTVGAADAGVDGAGEGKAHVVAGEPRR